MSQDVVGDDHVDTSPAASANKDAPSTSKDTEASSEKGKEKEKESSTPEELRNQLEILRKELASNLAKKQSIDRTLASHEASIYAFETSYLSVDLSGGASSLSFGNIVKGYDAYLKAAGATTTDSSRKKGGGSSTRGGYTTTAIVGPGGQLMHAVEENERIFSRSSYTYSDSLQLRDRDTGVLSASEGEDEDDEAGLSASKSLTQSQGPSSEQGGRDAKRPKRK